MFKISKRFISTHKNYYEILGVSPQSNLSQIKQALQQKLKEVGFSMNSSNLSQEQKREINKFFEAYGVLSVDKSKINVDKESLLSDQIDHVGIESLNDEVYKSKYLSEEHYRKQKFNLNQFDRYNGGHPNKGSIVRGNALNVPGAKRDFTQEHYDTMTNWDTDYRLHHADAEEFHVFQYSQKEQLQDPKSWHRVKIDEDFFSWRRYLHIYIALGFLGFVISSSVITKVYNYFYEDHLKQRPMVQDENGCMHEI